MKTRTDLAALILVALAIGAITLLTLQHQQVPEILSTVALVALGIGGGVALPRGTSTDAVATVAAETAAVVEAAPATPRGGLLTGQPAAPTLIPIPAPAAEAPVATHAP